MTSLTERYLAVAIRAVPAARRVEIATELRASIEDMVAGMTSGGQDAATAERAALTELGDPAQLGARYADRRLQLIGPTYYLAWQRLLTLLLTSVPATVGVLVGLVAFVNGEDAAGEGIAAGLQVALQIAFWVTLIFGVLERVDASLNLPKWSVDRLPKGPANQQITLTETAATVGALVLLIAYLPIQQFQSFVSTEGGGNLPILNPLLWSFWLPLLLVLLVAIVGLEIVNYRVGHWTLPLIAVNAILDLAVAGTMIWLLRTDRLLNPAFVQHFAWLRAGNHTQTVANVVVAGAVLVVLWNIVDRVVKAFRSRS
jgi:hypothetical protein